MREVGRRVADGVSDGGVETRGGCDGDLGFLSGGREAVVGAAVDAVGDRSSDDGAPSRRDRLALLNGP